MHRAYTFSATPDATKHLTSVPANKAGTTLWALPNLLLMLSLSSPFYSSSSARGLYTPLFLLCRRLLRPQQALLVLFF
jgi:hypothetical protein